MANGVDIHHVENTILISTTYIPSLIQLIYTYQIRLDQQHDGDGVSPRRLSTRSPGRLQ